MVNLLQLPYSEIADIMDCSRLTTQVLFYRAKRSLKQQLIRSGFGKGLLLTALGFFAQATFASDDFKKSQLAISNIISANMEFFEGSIGSFTDRMGVARNVMFDIANDAKKFNIPARELLETVKLVSGLTARQGLTGDNFGTARALSANYLKIATLIGSNPGLAMNQFAGIVTGQAEGGGQFTNRIFKEIGVEDGQGGIVNTAKEWNKFFKRDKIAAIKELNRAMDQFTKNGDELAARMNTIGALVQRVRDLFSGFGSILRPIGDQIMPQLVKGVNFLITFLETNGAKIGQEIANLIGPMMDNPRAFLERMIQMKNLASDVGKAAGITVIILFLILKNFLTE